MSAERLLLSEKYKAFLRCNAPVEFLEGTTAAGKTTVGLFKFMLKVAESPKKLHILAADDTGAAEKNIINKDLGILDDFGDLVEYRGNGSREYKMPHLRFYTSAGDRIIFVVGYGNKRKWKDALGGQYGCLYIDEINTADIDFIREASMRCDYLIATLNPDDPGLDVYKEYINCSRPLPEWENETPQEIREELKEGPKYGWVHWFFSFAHNPGLSAEKVEQIIRNTPKGTKIWKNKIEGLRGKAAGLIFPNFDRKKHVVTVEWVKKELQSGRLKFKKFTVGLDTSYSSKSPDTIAMLFQGITEDRKLITLAEKVYSNQELQTPLAPSDTAVCFVVFLEQCRRDWGFARDVYVDSADQATLTELKKYRRLHGCMYNFWDAYKKLEVLDRIKLQLGWIQQGCCLVVDACKEHLSELEKYSWDENKDKPEDRNDHTINAGQYAWIPYRNLIGFEEDVKKVRWISTLNENIKRGIRSWLNVQPAGPAAVQIREVMDFELSAIRNRIWCRGDGNELEQLYQQSPEAADRYKFWAGRCTRGMEMRKIHTGLPGLMVRILTEIVLSDMNDFDFSGSEQQKIIWEEIAKDNKFRKKLERALKEVLCIGDGAFKITIDTEVSEYPILEWYSGERVEYVWRRDRIKEVIFKTPYNSNGQKYTLNERYGYGYIKNELYTGERLADKSTLPETSGLADYRFDQSVLLAVPFRVFESSRYEGRGGSIFDGKLDNFDAFDEIWSQWMDASRAGRAKSYIPECLVPRDPETGQIIRPNPFDNRYFAADNDMSEKSENKIQTDQPAIPHDSYLAAYCTALDLCLQGVISPSTLGIDVKKLDNADAQREKEKATLYTRNAIVEALQETVPELVGAAVNAYNILMHMPIEEVQVDIPFGEYANPSFESQVETVVKGKQGGIMSIEASVDELYGDSKDEQWKQEEIARLKVEQGIAELEKPAVSLESGVFQSGETEETLDASSANVEPFIEDR